MDTKQSSEKRFALLIDADNVSAKYIKPITDELSKYGTVTYKRIYGDWTLTLHAKWKDALLENSITPIQQFGYTQGKNATDSAMIIDAMDILYTRSVEGFCIVSSDSDFTRLASRIRESGLTVIGMGEKKTPIPFRKACDIFTTLELLLGDAGGRSGAGNRGKARQDQGSTAAAQVTGTTISKDEVEQAVVNIITDNQNNGKSTGLGEVGSRLLKRYPDFDVRSYGTNLLSKLLDEFQSVQITKDGSSVTVELADDKERDHRERKGGRGKDAPRGQAEGSRDAEKALPPAGGKPEPADERPVEHTAEQAPAPSVDNRPGRASRKRAASRVVAKRTLDDAGSDREAEREAEQSPKPASRKLRRSTAVSQPAASELPAEEVAEPAVAKEDTRAGEGPAKAPRRKKAPAKGGARGLSPEPAAPQDASDEAVAEAKPRAGARRASAEPAAGKRSSDPEAFIRQAIADAEPEGVALATLGKRVRGKFRTFKLRDLGYSQFRSYIDDLDGLALEERDGQFYARLAR